MSTPISKSMNVQENRFWKLMACTGGIIGFFLLYGVTQERIMTQSYGIDGEKFTDTAFLVFLNRLLSVVFCLGMLSARGESLTPVAPILFYAFVAFCNFMSTYCQYEALKYVTFPTQTLGKCGKIIPVLVIGTMFQKKKYPFTEWIAAFMITVGCTLFLTTGEVSYKKGASSDTPIGLFLITVYLAFDGFTSTTQERLFKNYKMSSYNQMLYVNIPSAFISLFVLSLPGSNEVTGESENRLGPALSFAWNNPEFLFDAFTLSASSTIGQTLIYYTIKEFGALIYSTIMTTRQFLSILLSALLFLHPITGWQWFGSLLVFGALYGKSAVSGEKAKRTADVLASKEKSQSILPS